MEMHQLRYMAAVARTGNFSRAAERCHVSQPSLSQQIQKLESELGERLFDRLRRQATLTPAGEAFLPRAERILAEVDAAQREAREACGLIRGKLSVGVLPTIAPYFLPAAVAQFAAQFPGVEVVLQEETTGRLLNMLAACETDLAVVSLPLKDERFEFETLLTEELLLALPAKHPLNRKRTIHLTDLEGERFILMKEGHCLGDQVLGFCTSKDFHPQVSCRSAQVETIQALVRAGLGVSIVPPMATTPTAGPRPQYRSLAAPRPERTVVAAWFGHRPPGRAGAELLRCLKRVSAGEAALTPPITKSDAAH